MKVTFNKRKALAIVLTLGVLASWAILLPVLLQNSSKEADSKAIIVYRSLFKTPDGADSASEPVDPSLQDRSLDGLLEVFLSSPGNLKALHAAWTRIQAQDALLNNPATAVLAIEAARLCIDLGYLVPAKTFCSGLASRGNAEAGAWLGAILCMEANLAQNPLDKIDLVQKGLARMADQVLRTPEDSASHMIYLVTMVNLPEFFDCHPAILEELAWVLGWSKTLESENLPRERFQEIATLLDTFTDWSQDERSTLAPLLTNLRSSHAN